MTTRSELDAFLGPRRATERARLGIVVGGSLSEGLRIKLDIGAVPGGIIEDMAVGRYVVIGGQTGKSFFSIVTDIALDSTNPALEKTPPDTDDPFISEVFRSTAAFGRLQVSPMLALEEGGDPKPVKTIPAHYSVVYTATEADVNRIFGEADEKHWHIGEPLDMSGVKVNLDLARFVERSSGVFGKSGTGKSFVTRTILAGVIKARTASTLIFDMHNDYGWEVIDEAGRRFKGLRQLFSSVQVSVITLDPQTSQHRGSKVDRALQIGYDQIDPEDVEMLAGLMGLSDVQVGALFFLRRRLGKDWISKLLDETIPEEVTNIVEQGSIHAGTLGAIQRKFELFRRMDFLRPGTTDDAVDDIFNKISAGTSVVLEFGTFGNMLEAYVLVANYLTRRIHKKYVERKNKAAGNKAEEPNPLMIVIEEAHKFLDPAIAGHTIFGTIARELRKYNVTLLIVDQRPSGIEEEVMSQIGTRVTCLLDNEADIRAVFSGVSGGSALREVLARLDTKQQALILGHAVPMPVVVKTREYGQELYEAVGFVEGEALKKKAEKGTEALFGA
ncbi:MAG: ATP-binding protein [Chloroflexi bacterium]|nr:ATP-binding protein [Chloroflexota bacterium]